MKTMKTLVRRYSKLLGLTYQQGMDCPMIRQMTTDTLLGNVIVIDSTRGSIRCLQKVKRKAR